MRFHHGCCLLAVLAAALLSGCNQEAAKTPATTTTTSAVSDEEQSIAAEIAKLPAAEQAAALAQKYCPVSVMDGGDNRLGSMGMPYKVTLDGQDVFLCCEGCQATAEKDAAKTLATVEAVKKRAESEKKSPPSS